MPFKTLKLSDDVSVIQETGVANFMRCNIWHVKGRDFDLVIDTGMGLDPLKEWVMKDTDRPIKAIVTHCHFDHSGCLHEFDERLGHRAEADILANPSNPKMVYEGSWTRIGIVDLNQHPEYSSETFHVKAAPLTAYLDEGDVIDLGDKAFQILHLPGHSPGSIGLWDMASKTLFSGDALYDGELLDNLYHSDVDVYLQTLGRIESLGAEIFHAGHFPSFGEARMREIIHSYRSGSNSLGDIKRWFEDNKHRMRNIFGDQNWEKALK
ncbi:MAG: MBL fold metallo-hydrolase [Rhizobiaceae bacterium]|nr:MBL fold metallo-hydrolase [Rhizobiaceae bacterium]